MADDKPAAKEKPAADSAPPVAVAAKEKPAAKEPAPETPPPATAAALDELSGMVTTALEAFRADLNELTAAAAADATGEAAKTLADFKAWARRELHLHANGANHEEREALNP